MNGWGRAMFQVISGYIYFIQMGEIGPIKIGFTKDVKKRLFFLQTATPYSLRLLCVFPGNEEMEREIHTCLGDIRLRGEWFLPHPFLLRAIEEEERINKQNGFIEPDPSYDIGDWTLGGEKWESPPAIKIFNLNGS